MRACNQPSLPSLSSQGEIEGAIIRKDEAVGPGDRGCVACGRHAAERRRCDRKGTRFRRLSRRRGKITREFRGPIRSRPPSFSIRPARPACQRAWSSRTARPSIALSGYRRRPGCVRAPTTGRSGWCRSATLSAFTARSLSRSPITAHSTRCPLSIRSPRTI